MTDLRTGGRILVDQLVAQGCDRIFCVPGESYLPVLDALVDTPEIALVVARQEGGAAFMACADGSMTGRPGICFVTRGPGATNASIGVHVAMQDSVPMILFVGDVARGDRDREAFQEVDFAAMFGPLAKWAARIDDAARIPEYVARAYATAMSGRPGPVVLALPEDMLGDAVDAVDRPLVLKAAQGAGAPMLNTLDELIEAARAPLAIVGGAGWTREAGAAVARWAEGIGLPVACAFRRQDAIPNDSPIYAGNLGYGPNPKLVERVRDADLLIVIGARLGEATTDGYALITPDHPGQTLVHVHPDPAELNRVHQAGYAICADVTAFARALDEAGWICWKEGLHEQAHADWLAWSTPTPNGRALDLGLCVAHMREVLPADSIVCNGAGNFSGWFHRFWHYAAMPSQLAPTAGAMGYGLPAGVAAALRDPDRQVIVAAGDGDFLMNGQELATAVAQGARMLVLVIDNGSYGTIRMHQERRYPERVSGTELVNPDFAALARAYGCWAETVERTEAFASALKRAMAEPGVALLHLKTEVEQLAPAVTISGLRGTSG
ncbi:thiamine pyrophosphate-binding protein [Sphingomonas jatrophae]|uniref:Acetolactate synthase-1/2/3 large subunit n=1 Tax=Sphingomonas jatrophae TaxID=1166337 RepID=A0A1I6K917_9SPHN|nr:thiamine pyrophosphate-binding protein [Sphingomonas jatrophae]SFR87731.1 acetolactate synthase-1/2/3 large subunit [Sphingomonas jatrophae]